MSYRQILIAAAGCIACCCLAGCQDKTGSTRTSAVADDHGAAGHAPHGDEAGQASPDDGGHAPHGDAGHAPHDEGAPPEAGGHAHVAIVDLGPEVLKEFGVEVGTATLGDLESFLSLPGEVSIDADRVTHVVTPIEGVITAVHKNLGDSVKRGDLMIEIDSTDLADSKTTYLQAVEHRKLAKSTFEREEMLWERGVAAEQEYLAAKNALAEADISIRAAEQRLLALRVPKGEVEQLAGNPSANLTKYRVYAPASGQVVEKHAVRGELLTPDKMAFTLADLSTVWIRLSVHQRDLDKIRMGQEVVIDTPDGKGSVRGKVDYIEPVIGEESRQAVARVKLSNPGGAWRPGLFVTGKVLVSAKGAGILVPQDALQTHESDTVVFVETKDGFVPRPVKLGRQTETHAEVLSGLKAGEKYVITNAFLVKAELGKATAEHAH